jgi:putative endonuclease
LPITAQTASVHHVPYVYILECSDGSFYVGSTWLMEHRLVQHNEGRGAAYTRKRRPVRLAWHAWYDSVAEAYAMEKRIQGWSRAKRRALIDGRFTDLPGLSQRGFRKPASGGG